MSAVPGLTRAAVAQWLIDTCTLFGADLSTSLHVAALFISDFDDSPAGVVPTVQARRRIGHHSG